MKIGNILKLKTHHQDIVNYELPLSGEFIELNPLIGKTIRMHFDGIINDIETGEVIRKSYGQGHSWESYITLPQCDQCIFQPELCHYAQGTCRDPKWGDEHCMQPHVIYLANSSELKVGITRQSQVPTRWMDQGASFALPIAKVKNRLTSGLIEVELAKKFGDKTNWRKMLSGVVENLDLIQLKKDLLVEFNDLLARHQAEVLPDQLYTFNYPVEKYPSKISMLTFDKTPTIESKLLGIKGQYLILEEGVINIRRHQGYKISFEY
jgi:hypothetical protein